MSRGEGDHTAARPGSNLRTALPEASHDSIVGLRDRRSTQARSRPPRRPRRPPVLRVGTAEAGIHELADRLGHGLAVATWSLRHALRPCRQIARRPLRRAAGLRRCGRRYADESSGGCASARHGSATPLMSSGSISTTSAPSRPRARTASSAATMRPERSAPPVATPGSRPHQVAHRLGASPRQPRACHRAGRPASARVGDARDGRDAEAKRCLHCGPSSWTESSDNSHSGTTARAAVEGRMDPVVVAAQPRPQRFGEHAEGRGGHDRRPPRQHRDIGLASKCRQLAEEPGLADTALADEQHARRLPGPGRTGGCAQELELIVPADHNRGPRRRSHHRGHDLSLMPLALVLPRMSAAALGCISHS